MKRGYEKKEKKGFYILYTLTFAALFLFLYSYFYLNGKSMVWAEDGTQQHLNSLTYWGQYLRQVIRTLAQEHRLELPMWDMSIGYGSDIYNTLHYYVVGDPLTLLAVFVPMKYMETFYGFLIVLRLYLSGIAFSIYCLYHNNSKPATYLGTIAYVFAGWGIFAGFKHPYFVNPMIYLPLILMGIDKIYKKEKPHVFIWSTFVAAISNFYFFYMICIFMFLYAAIRYFGIFKERSVKDVFLWFLKFLGYFGISLMMACALLLPIILSLFGTKRFGVEHYIPAVYNLSYYEKYLGSLLGDTLDPWGVTGFSGVAMAGVFVIFSKRKKNWELKLAFILGNLFLLIPFAGHVINGFSYVGNRWMWAYAMMIAYILVRAYPEIFVMSLKEKKRLLIFLFVYIFAVIAFRSARTERNLMGLFFLAGSAVCVLAYGHFWRSRRLLCGLLAFLLLCNTAMNISYVFGEEAGYLSQFYDEGTPMEYLNTGSGQAIYNTGDISVYRYDNYDFLNILNSSMHMGLNGTSYYFSLASNAVSQFQDDMNMNVYEEFQYGGLDGRSILERLAAVKYVTIRKGAEAYLPYGYTELKAQAEKDGQQFLAYENPNALPLGYTYDTYISQTDYEKMSAVEKQQALLQGVVLDESILPETEPTFLDREIPFELIPSDGCVIEDGKIIVTKTDATVSLQCKGIGNSETYFIVEGLDYDNPAPMDRIEDETWESFSLLDKLKFWKKNLDFDYWTFSKFGQIKVSSDTTGTYDWLRVLTPRHNFYCGIHDFLCNLKYSEEPLENVTLTFSRVGVYTYDDMKLVCQPMDQVDEQTEKLGEEALENVTLSANTIQGNITVSKPKALVLAVPYSTGFKAYVDGEETELMPANSMFMAVELSEGSHEIKITYCRPYARLGLGISAAGLVIYLLLCIYERRRKTK